MCVTGQILEYLGGSSKGSLGIDCSAFGHRAIQEPLKRVGFLPAIQCAMKAESSVAVRVLDECTHLTSSSLLHILEFLSADADLPSN
jgi:hypothetical protein